MSARVVTFVTVEPLGERLAGPAIRALELSRALARSGVVDRVQLVSLAGCERADEDVELSVAGPDLRDRVTASSAVVLQGDVLNRLPWLAGCDVPLVVDAYDPFHLEQLEQTRGQAVEEQAVVVRDALRALNGQLRRADLVLCASSRQRGLWLGHLAALGRVNPMTYAGSPDLADLVVVVPFGTTVHQSQRRPGSRAAVLGRDLPGVGEEDVLLVWGGGLYPWFDPQTLLAAMAVLAGSRPQTKLLFLGTRHPLQTGGEPPLVTGLRERAAADGTLGRSVFLHDGWVAYDQLHDWLGAADIGVSTHHPHLETEFSFRTRVVDYLAAGLPVVTTEGDALADLVAATGAGRTVPAGDVGSLVRVLEELADDADERARCAARAAAAARGLDWDLTAAPLVRWCADPRRAPDLVAPGPLRALLAVDVGGPLGRLQAAVAEGGPQLLARRLARRLRRPVV